LSALTFAAAGIAFAWVHGAAQGEVRVVAETYIAFLITALVMKVAALGLEMTFRRAVGAEAALRQAETNLKNLRNAMRAGAALRHHLRADPPGHDSSWAHELSWRPPC
jgi:hypothetical protein